jgi:MFS transporter
VAAGVVPSSAPELGPVLAGLLMSLPLALCLIVEAPLFLLADRARDRAWLVRAGCLGIAASCLASAWAPRAWLLVAAQVAFAPLWGLGTGVAQTALVALDARRAERQMMRWTLAAALGDIASPALLAACVALGGGWRHAFATVAAAAALAAALVPRLPRAAAATPEGDALPLRAALAAAWRDRRLVAWTAGAAACTLMDEIILALIALHLDARGVSAGGRALVLGSFLAGAAAGLLVQERLLARVAPLRLLAAASAACLAAHAIFILAPSAPLAALVGATSAGQYPIAKAQAYRAAGDRPGAINALAALFSPLEAAAPVLLALLAAAAGTGWALLALAVQPLAMLALALRR